MSDFGGMDRGVPGDAPFMGRLVAYQPTEGEFVPATVMDVREDGWTVSLVVPGETTRHEFVAYGGSLQLGLFPVGTWMTVEEYEGTKIFAAERAAQQGG